MVDNDYAALDAFIASLRSVDGFAERVAQRGVGPVLAAARSLANAGQGPDGEAWAPLKGGGRALAGAASDMEATAAGDVISFRIRAPYYFHSSGTTRVPKRRVIPELGSELPKAYAAALAAAAEAEFRKTFPQ